MPSCMEDGILHRSVISTQGAIGQSRREQNALVREDVERGQNARADNNAQSRASAGAVPMPSLHYCFHRSHQCRLRGIVDECRPASFAGGFRVWRRTVLYRILSIRGPEQSDPRKGRRATLDRAGHDHLGHSLDGLGFDRRAKQLSTPCASCLASPKPGFSPASFSTSPSWVSQALPRGASPPAS